MSPHSDTFSWLRAKQSLHFLLNDVCLAEEIIVFGLIRLGLEPTVYRSRGEHVSHYTTDAVHNYGDSLNTSRDYNI